ncbi:MAG: SCO family protein [Deltaproteobacteria bacterium]|nr:SCO family protein [Deltaproteobacteria bacterium]
MPRRGALLADLVGKPISWVVFVAVAFGWPVARAIRREAPPPLPVLGQLAAFTLRDQHGEPFGSRQLQGKVWVADFVFTRCPTICPALTATMGKIQHRSRNLADAFHLVTFSVDPDHDTPSKLAELASRHRVGRRWTFLTGSFADVQRTVVSGLKIGMGRDEAGAIDRSDFASVFHGTHLVLVDRRLRIRGYYGSTEPSAVDRLMSDVGLVVNER